MCEGLPRAAGPRPSGDPRRERGWRSEPRGSRPPAPDPASAQPGLDAGAVRAEFERNLLMERCAAGAKIARQRKVRFGRPPKLTPSLIRQVLLAHDDASTTAR